MKSTYWPGDQQLGRTTEEPCRLPHLGLSFATLAVFFHICSSSEHQGNNVLLPNLFWLNKVIVCGVTCSTNQHPANIVFSILPLNSVPYGLCLYKFWPLWCPWLLPQLTGCCIKTWACVISFWGPGWSQESPECSAHSVPTVPYKLDVNKKRNQVTIVGSLIKYNWDFTGPTLSKIPRGCQRPEMMLRPVNNAFSNM